MVLTEEETSLVNILQMGPPESRRLSSEEAGNLKITSKAYTPRGLVVTDNEGNRYVKVEGPEGVVLYRDVTWGDVSDALKELGEKGSLEVAEPMLRLVEASLHHKYYVLEFLSEPLARLVERHMAGDAQTKMQAVGVLDRLLELASPVSHGHASATLVSNIVASVAGEIRKALGKGVSDEVSDAAKMALGTSEETLERLREAPKVGGLSRRQFEELDNEQLTEENKRMLEGCLRGRDSAKRKDALDVLETKLTEGEKGERTWAIELLERTGGMGAARVLQTACSNRRDDMLEKALKNVLLREFNRPRGKRVDALCMLASEFELGVIDVLVNACEDRNNAVREEARKVVHERYREVVYQFRHYCVTGKGTLVINALNWFGRYGEVDDISHLLFSGASREMEQSGEDVNIAMKEAIKKILMSLEGIADETRRDLMVEVVRKSSYQGKRAYLMLERAARGLGGAHEVAARALRDACVEELEKRSVLDYEGRERAVRLLCQFSADLPTRTVRDDGAEVAVLVRGVRPAGSSSASPVMVKAAR